MTNSHAFSRTLGVDLASAAKKTGVCVLAWANGFAEVETLEVGADDGQILSLQRSCDAVGIDAPFAWPASFLSFLAREAGDYVPEWTTEYRDQLRFRRTDHYVRQILDKPALSVSSDLIAVPAMRCAGLLANLGVEDFSGDGRVFEVYPAGALIRWKMASKGYKGQRGKETRKLLVEQICLTTPWLRLDQDSVEQMKASDDALDAVICALVARAAALGLSDDPPDRDVELARSEGWIHLPAADCLERLGNFA